MADGHQTIRALFKKAHFNTEHLRHHGIQLLVDLELVKAKTNKVTCIGARATKKVSNGAHCGKHINEKTLPGIVVNLYSMAGDRTIADDQLHGHIMIFVEHLLCSHHDNEAYKRKVADVFVPVYLQYREQHLISAPATPPTVNAAGPAFTQDMAETFQQLIRKNESLEWELQQAMAAIHGQQVTIGEQEDTIGAQQHTIVAQQDVLGEQQRVINEQQAEGQRLLLRLTQLQYD
ncbi:hypothetical protein LTR85_007500 [Meristemomyces frigidus]|nr:hypothetical protein LTR85_007500 [Meristemomyces frigidus]